MSEPRAIGALVEVPTGARGRGVETPEQYKARCKAEGDRNRAKVERLRGVIQQLKASRAPQNEHALIRLARELDHADVDGLLQAIADRNNQASVKSGAFKRSRDT